LEIEGKYKKESKGQELCKLRIKEVIEGVYRNLGKKKDKGKRVFLES